MADDVTGVDMTAGLLNFVADDGEDPAFEGEFGGDEAWFGGWFFLDGGYRGAGHLYLGSHRPKVSSCI